MMNPSLRVAIIGGGLAGTILMNALLKHAHLEVHLYEAKSQLQERGASVGLSINAQRAMHLMGLEEVMRRAGAVKAEGPEDGNHVYDIDFGKETVYRAALLRELLAPIPPGSIHLNKRLDSIHGTTISFTDNTSAEADVIIGADGIHSGVRRFVLGDRHPAIEPVLSGFWDARTLVSHDEAAAKLGLACINGTDPHQHAHIGSKGMLFHDTIDDGQRVCIVASGPIPSHWENSQWTQTLTREWMDEQYGGWGQYGRNGLDLLFGTQSSIQAFIQRESAVAPSFYHHDNDNDKNNNDKNKTKTNVCIIGDAAHAMSPWQGTGLAQAIEDSLILDQLLGRCCRSTDDVPFALGAYDHVRRPHTQKVVETSRMAGEAYFAAHAGGAEALRRQIPSREYILDYDTEGAIGEAVEVFERLRGGRGPM